MAEDATSGQDTTSATEDDDAQDQTETAAQGDDDGEDTDGEGKQDGTDGLGDAGKKALDAMKQKWKAERDKRRAAENALAEAKTGKGDGKKADGATDPEQVRRDAERAALGKANARILRAEVKAAAAGKLTDPRDALQFLDLTSFEVDDDGNVDTDEIADAIADLIKNKPYLAAQGGQRFQGSGDGGPRNGDRKSQLTREDLARMSPEERLKAHEQGRTKTLLGN